VEVEPTFDPSLLPALLADASLGIFPSYWEGFPFGVLEQMAVGLPVVAFDAPGPPMLVPKHLLVPVGDERRMADLVVGLLRDRDRLRAERQRAADIAQAFEWEDIAKRTLVAYEGAITRFGRQKPAAGAPRAY
jgi:glycosyltransferase involved in cell wall biosynthesis